MPTLPVRRRARYALDGDPEGELRDVWFVLHGYAQLASDFVAECAPLSAPGRLLVAPEGLSRFYLRRSDGRVGASWMTREAREDEIADTVEFLDALHAALLGERDVERVHVLGFSQGAAAACRWAALGSSRVDRVIAWAGGFPPDLEAEAWPAGTELVLVAGDDDPWVKEPHIRKELARLERAGLPYRTERFAGGHELDAAVLRALAAD